MKEIHRIWQKQWREILSENTDDFPPIDADFTIHFKFWEQTKDQIRACFSSMPYGISLAERVIEMKWGNIARIINEPINDHLLIERVLELINRMTEFVELSIPTQNDIRIIRGNSTQRIELLTNSDPLTLDLNDQLSSLIRQHSGEEAYAAYFFLSEIFYRFASDYRPTNWMLWGMLEHLKSPTPYEIEMELYRHKADVAIDEIGVFIFIEEKNN